MEKKLLLLTLLLQLMPCIVLSQETTIPLVDIIVTTGEDFYRVETPTDSVELFLYKSDQEIPCETPYIIPRTNEWQHYIFIARYTDAWDYNEYGAERDICIPPLGQEIPPSPEIIVTNNGDRYTVSAISNYIETGDYFNDPVFAAWCPWGDWTFMYPDDSFTINREDEEQVYWFKAYNSINGPEYWNLDYFCGLQSQEVRQKVVIPAKERTPDPVITVTPSNKYYTVTVTGDGYISVSLNGSYKGGGTNSYQFNINRVYVDKNYKIEATAHDSQKRISNKVSLDLVVPALEKTPTPQIIVTPGDLTYTVEAVGVGQVYLQFNQKYPQTLENPYVINRYYEEEVYSFRAWAIEEDKQASDYAYLDLVVPAAAVTPSPEITFTEDIDGCWVKATGEGTVRLYYRGEEVDNPYKIMRPYQTRYITFSATAVANGKLESETYDGMEVTADPSFVDDPTNEHEYSHGNNVDTVFIESKRPGDAWYYDLQPEKIQARGNGNIRLFVDSVEVDNPYFLDGRGKALPESYRMIATAKEDGKLTGQRERIYIFPPSPSPEPSHFVQITSDEDNYYLTAEKKGYLMLSCGSKATGQNSVSLSRARPDNTYYTQYHYTAICVDSINNAITCDKGILNAVGTKFNKMLPIVLVWASEDEYKVSAHHSFWLSQDNSDGDHIASGAILMRNGQKVDNPYFIDRTEYDQVFNDFSAALTIEIQHYTQIAPGSSIVVTNEILEVSNKRWQEPVVVAAGGDNFYVRQEIDGLKYYSNIKRNENGHHVMHHAYVQENQEFVGDAIIPDFVDCGYMEMWDQEPHLYWVNGAWGWEWDGTGWGGSTFEVSGSCPVTEIADSAFYADKQLTGITLGRSVSFIGNRAFADCSNLNYVKCFSIQPPEMEAETCFNCYKTATLWVPSGSADRYKLTDWWNKFDDIKEFDLEVLHGDVNCDGEIGISDVNALIDLILSEAYNSTGDINNDGEIGISDINALLDLILE